MRRHSRAGGNPDLRLSEIFNDYRSVGFAHENGEEKESRLKFSVWIAGKAHATSAAFRSPQVVWKNSSHIPANRAVIPAKAGIQTFGFQKYSMITVA